MNQYQKLAQRYYKFFIYCRRIAVISFLFFIIVTAINTGNDILELLSLISMWVFFGSTFEAAFLYILSIIMSKRK